MFTTQSIDYSLSLPTRCLSSLPHRSPPKSPLHTRDDIDDHDKEDDHGWDEDSYNIDDDDPDASGHRFLVGSARPTIFTSEKLHVSAHSSGEEEEKREEEEEEERSNHLHLLAYHEDSHEITLEASYAHPTGEIWSMAVNPRNGTVATCGGGVLLTQRSIESDAEGGDHGGTTKLVDFVTKVWKLQNDEGFTGDEMRLEPIVTIPHGETLPSPSGWEKRVGCILWNPLLSTGESTPDEADASLLLTVGWETSSPISLWDISTSAAVEAWSTIPSSSHAGGMRRRRRTHPLLQNALPRRASWDPHDTHNILCTTQRDVVAYDTRCSGSVGVGVIRSAHRYGVADVHHNRLRENAVVTSGLDGVVKFWDLRFHGAAVREEDGGADDASCVPVSRLLKAVRGGHSHWATRAVYNPFYDQLVLSGGTDGLANLWRVSSCSSAPLLEFDGEDEDIGSNEEEAALEEEEAEEENAGYDDWAKEEKEEYIQDNPLMEDEGRTDDKNHGSSKLSSNDVRVSRFECSDSTADLCWSASDPWIYATLSCDGSVVVHHVPSKEKYKILL